MEVTVTRQSPKDYLDLTSGPKMYPQFCQRLRKMHPQFRLVKNPRAKKVPKQYIKLIGQPESKEVEYEERWEIWREVGEELKYLFCIFRPTYPETWKGVFKEPGEYELNLVKKAQLKFEMDYAAAMAQQDPESILPKLEAHDAKEEIEEKYKKKVQWEKDTDDMERDVKAGALQERSYSFGPKEETGDVDEHTKANLKTLALIKKKRLEEAKKKAHG